MEEDLRDKQEWKLIKKAWRKLSKEMEDNMYCGLKKGKTGWENWEPAMKSAKEKVEHYLNLPENASIDEKIVTLADIENYVFMEFIKINNENKKGVYNV